VVSGGEAPKLAAAKRWVPWLCAFTGARVGEMLQLRKAEILGVISPRSRFYIAPLGPKPQMLGAALYYMAENAKGAVSLIYPVVSSHAAATSSGVSIVAINTIDFPLLDSIAARN
jgi:hypothetical protein